YGGGRRRFGAVLESGDHDSVPRHRDGGRPVLDHPLHEPRGERSAVHPGDLRRHRDDHAGLWAGRNYAQTTMLKTYNGSPAFAIKFNEYISVALGAQVQFAQANLNTGFLAAPGSHIGLDAHGWGFGATAGVTFTPGPNTSIGLGWRSGINQKLDNALLTLNPLVGGSTPGLVKATVNLPDMVNFGISHRFDAVWTVKAGVEWANWSRIGTVNIQTAAGAPATIGGVPVTLPF